jgi:hypothetical protein
VFSIFVEDFLACVGHACKVGMRACYEKVVVFEWLEVNDGCFGLQDSRYSALCLDSARCEYGSTLCHRCVCCNTRLPKDSDRLGRRIQTAKRWSVRIGTSDVGLIAELECFAIKDLQAWAILHSLQLKVTHRERRQEKTVFRLPNQRSQSRQGNRLNPNQQIAGQQD